MPRDLAVLGNNMARMHELERLRALCESHGIPMLYLKGAAFLDTLYLDPGERPMADVDVLVRDGDRPAVDRILAAEGYQRIRLPERPVSEALHHEWCYTGKPVTHLEVHARFCYPQEFDIDYDGVWARAVGYQTPYRPVPTLSPEDSLLYVSLHEGLHSFLIDLRSSEDVRRIVEVWQPDWRTVVERAEQWHMTLTLFTSLRASRAQRGTEVPSWVLDRLRPSPLRLALLERLVDLDGTGRSRASGWSRLQQLLFMLLNIERPTNLLRFLKMYGGLRLRDFVQARVRGPSPR